MKKGTGTETEKPIYRTYQWKAENSLFWNRYLETWKMKYWVGLYTGNRKPGFQTRHSMHISMSVLNYYSAMADC